MRLSAPNLIVFLISFIVALAVVATKYLGATIPFIGENAFLALLLAYGILAVSNLVRGL